MRYAGGEGARGMDISSARGVTARAEAGAAVIAWPDGDEMRLPAAWLADNAQGARDQVGGNRLKGALGLAGLSVRSARVEGDGLAAELSDGETRRVALTALAADRPAPAALWAVAADAEDGPPIDFAAYMAADAALAEALRRLARRGILFLTGAPTEPGVVERFVGRFGYIRETNYGRLFDVREEARPSHLAYSPVGLELHTDNPYRDPEPTLQALHVIEAASEGGESLFADGFAHAEALRAAAPARFDVLARTPVPFSFESASGERLVAWRPILETDGAGGLRSLRVNHRAMGAAPAESADAWYEAYLDLYARLHAPDACVARKLAPGEIVLFDNRRVLHGRAPYQALAGRWLQGCYAERDGLLATLARLTR
jgi:gamma-butyrobetaine dioxygenase